MVNIVGETLSSELSFKLKERIKYESFGNNKVGVFAFSRLQEARKRDAFDLPEIFWDIGDRKIRDEIEKSLKKILKPTIIKFYKEYSVSELDVILFKYWYLICQKFDDEYTSDSNDVGQGVDIPFEQIQEIFVIS